MKDLSVPPTLGSNGIFKFGVIIAALLSAGVVHGSVLIDGDETSASSFTFTVLTPPTQIEPVNGNFAGGSSVTIRAFWGVVVAQQDAGVTFGGKTSVIKSVVSNSANTLIIVTFPPGVKTGLVPGEILGQEGLVSYFNFEYYDALVFADIQPRITTFDGRVGGCDKCLLDNDGRHLNVRVQNFPKVYSASDFQVSIGTTKCTGTSCAVKSIQSIVGGDFCSQFLSRQQPWLQKSL